jgi:DNA-binding beta-propeller fold protein YncE
MRTIVATLIAFVLCGSATAQDKFKVATLDTSANMFRVLEFTIPNNGTPTVAIGTPVRLPSGPEHISRAAAGDLVYVSSGSAGQIVVIDVAMNKITATAVTNGLPRKLQVATPTCLLFGSSPTSGNPAVESSPLPTLAPALVASPPTTRFLDIDVLMADNLAFLASTHFVTSAEVGEIHRLDTSSCPGTLKETVALPAGKAAFAISPTSKTAALASVSGEADLFAINFTGGTATRTPIAQFPVKPRLIRRLAPLANRHYVIDLDGQVTLLDTSVMPPLIVAALVVGAGPSVALVDPAGKWLVVLDRKSPFDARLYKITSGTVDPNAAMLVRLTAPVNDAVMLP